MQIVLSGPKTRLTHARAALQGAGFRIHDTDHDHGLPEWHETEIVDGTPVATDAPEPQTFLTLDGDDIDLAQRVSEPLGWRLRAHHDTPEETPPSGIAATLEDMRQRITELEAKVGG